MRRALFSSRNQCPRPIQASEYVDRRAKLIDDLKVDDKTPLVLLQSAVKSFSAPDVPHNFRYFLNTLMLDLLFDSLLLKCLESGFQLLNDI